MYAKLLSMTWDEMMNSDYVFKSNVEKRVIQIFGNEFVKDDDSLILVYYNVYTNKPMICIQRYNRKGVNITPEEVDGFAVTMVEDVEEDGSEFTEITYVLCSLQEALQS